MKIHCKYDKLVPLVDLKHNPHNRNKHPKEQITRLAKILKYQGWRYPVKVSNQTGFVTSGHGRIMAAVENGWKDAPVNFQDYDDFEQEYADVQADNAIASWSELNLGMINTDLPDLGPDFDIDLLGIKDFVVEPADKFKTDPDEVPEVKESICKLGDIWELGNHRLMCGDSTSRDVLTLMSDKLADLWITDPPYGVNYQSNGAEEKHKKIKNDSMPLEQMGEFWFKLAHNAYSSTSMEAPYYWFACGGEQMMMMMMSISRATWKVRHELIWAKDQMVLGRCDYHYKHEPILYGWKKDGKHNWYADRSQTSLLEFKRPKSSDMHPTMKPVELVEYLISNSSKQKDVVLDLCGGSGTTLIASEKTNRKCFMMEIDPHYCDVIIKRWEDFTGKKAKKIG